MERNGQTLVFLIYHPRGLYVVLSFTPHLENTAVGQKYSGLKMRSAAMDTGEHWCFVFFYKF